MPGVTDRDASLIVIRPKTGWMPVDPAELCAPRELLYFLVWRDIKVKYKQTAIGMAWAILQPLLAMAVFTLFFRQARQGAVRRPAVSGFFVHRTFAMDLLCDPRSALHARA